MISKKHKTVFVHVPKVAGQSIEQMFLEDLGLDWAHREELLLRRKKPNEQGPERLAHLVAKDYVGLGYISKQDYNDFFTFSFVRDPYKRVFSFYNFLGYSRIISFRTFVEYVVPMKLEHRDFFFLSQYDYLHDGKGKLLVDFVGRLENIRKDILTVKEKCGLNDVTLPHANKSKGEWKRSLGLLWREAHLRSKISLGEKGKHFEDVLTEDLKNKIYDLYNKDFKAFEYKK